MHPGSCIKGKAHLLMFTVVAARYYFVIYEVGHNLWKILQVILNSTSLVFFKNSCPGTSAEVVTEEDCFSKNSQGTVTFRQDKEKPLMGL